MCGIKKRAMKMPFELKLRWKWVRQDMEMDEEMGRYLKQLGEFFFTT